MKHLLVCLLMLLAVPAAAQVSTSKTVTITITAPAGVCTASPPPPAVAAGFTTQALCSDWTVAMPANWMGGCATAGNRAPVNSGDQSGHNWWLNPWFSNTYQPCIATQVTDPTLGGTALDLSWVTDSNAYNVGTELQSTAWFSTGTPNSGISFPNNAYYEMTFRMAPITKGTWGGIFTWPVLAQTDSSKEGIENDVIEMDVGQLSLMDAAIHNWPLSGPPGQFIWQGYGANNGGIGIGVPLSFDPTVYHTFGLQTVSDGVSNYQTCTFVDGVTNSCSSNPIPGGWPVASEATLRYMLMMINACDFWNGTCNPNGTLQHMYVKDVKVWSCATWATTECNKPVTINATDFCAANGGGNGSAGSPWQAACIQAAINAAASGNTVSLAAGNWALNTTAFGAAGAVITGKSVNLVGAGSGNTVDAYGHPNNPMWNKTGTYTRVFTTGANTGCNTNESSCHSSSPGPGGFIRFANCASNNNNTVAHIFFDGSVVSAGGDAFATINTDNCSGINFNDIRVWAYECPGAPCPNSADASDPETQFFIFDTSNNTTVQNSIFSEPPVITNGSYPGSQIFQVQLQNGMLVKNNMFYMNTGNPIYMDNVTWTGNYTTLKNDNLGGPAVIPTFGPGGCSNMGCYNGDPNGQTSGNFHFTTSDNVFDGGGGDFGTGGGINDPSTAGILNDLNWTGNWVLGTNGVISSCSGHIPSLGYCGTNTSGISGMQINLPSIGDSFNITNNSIVTTTSARLDATGTGCNNGGGADGQGSCPAGQLNNTVVNFKAQKNFLSSPSNQYLTDSMTITPTVTGNFCSGSAGGAWCTTAGFTQAPTVTFTLGTASGGVVPFASTNFTAQYGAVQWLASTSATTPTSGGQVGGAVWNRLPPVSLAAVSGNTIFMWTMDSAGHISAPASAVVP